MLKPRVATSPRASLHMPASSAGLTPACLPLKAVVRRTLVLATAVVLACFPKEPHAPPTVAASAYRDMR